LADRALKPPESVVDAALKAARSTGIDPALLLTIAWTESGFHADAKSQTSSARGLMQFTKQTWLESLKTFGGKHGLSHLVGLIHRSGTGHLVAHVPAKHRLWSLRNDPRTATLLAAERLDYQRVLSKDRALQIVDLYLIHALGITGANRFVEAVTERPSAPCKAAVGDAAWKNSGLFRDLPHGAATPLGAAYGIISRRFEQRYSYYANLLEYDVPASDRETDSEADHREAPH
jgi:hypothetical protein